jgi:hypothetical protein
MGWRIKTRGFDDAPPLNEQSTPLFFVFRVIRAFLPPVRDGWKDAAGKRTEFCEYHRLRNGRRHRGYLLFAFLLSALSIFYPDAPAIGEERRDYNSNLFFFLSTRLGLSREG